LITFQHIYQYLCNGLPLFNKYADKSFRLGELERFGNICHPSLIIPASHGQLRAQQERLQRDRKLSASERSLDHKIGELNSAL
jgi:hypothetical protein